ncbi:MAG: DUF4230 domain-containing protein [Bacteroidota bacterium]
MKKWILSLIVILALSTAILGLLQLRSCTNLLEIEPPRPVATHSMVLKEIEGLGRMELIRYQFQDVVDYEVVLDWFPDPKVILSVQGETVGCVDFAKIDSSDIVIVGDSLVEVYLPYPEICYSKIDHSKTRVFDTDNTFWVEAELVAEAYELAEKKILEQALQGNILEQTQAQALSLLTPILEAIADKEVSIRFDLPPPNVERPND